MIGISGTVGIVGGIIPSFLKDFNFDNYKFNFEVNIFSDKNEDMFKERLPERMRNLKAYTRLVLSGRNVFDEVKVYMNYDELNISEYRDYILERLQEEKEFSLVVTSPSIGGTKKYSEKHSFLDNDNILKIINWGVKAELSKGKLYSQYRKKFSYFNFDNEEYSFRSGEKIHDKTLPPKNAKFQLEGDNVLYNIYGLEALTNNDEEKLKREWLLKMSEIES